MLCSKYFPFFKFFTTSITLVVSIDRYGFLSNPESVSNKRPPPQLEENFHFKRRVTETNLSSVPDSKREKGSCSLKELSFDNTAGSQQVHILIICY